MIYFCVKSSPNGAGYFFLGHQPKIMQKYAYSFYIRSYYDVEASEITNFYFFWAIQGEHRMLKVWCCLKILKLYKGAAVFELASAF